MVRGLSGGGVDFSQLERALRTAKDSAPPEAAAGTGQAAGGFSDMLAKSIKEVNEAVKGSEQASMDLASGKSSNIHETMISVTKAELGFNMMVQLRNKAIEAYQEVMRMQV